MSYFDKQAEDRKRMQNGGEDFDDDDIAEFINYYDDLTIFELFNDM